MAKVSKENQEKARVRLLGLIKPGDTIHTVLRHVSRSGMSRRIDLYKLDGTDAIYLTASVADLLGYRCKTFDNGLTVNGCGMDMGFAVVYDLSYTLFPNGFECLGEKCPSNDHVNYRGSREQEPRGVGVMHKDGGYALKHSWL